MSSKTAPTAEQAEDVLLSCRYGELDEVKEFVETFGAQAIVDARDERGNTVLHMCCGNGHLGMCLCLGRAWIGERACGRGGWGFGTAVRLQILLK